jgi:hypothetical protein
VGGKVASASILSALVIVFAAPLVAAGPPEDAAELLQKGIELRRAGHDVEALDLFRRANELAPSPRARAQLGLAEQALGRWVAAERDIAAALDAGGDAWIVKNRPVLEQALAVVRDHVGQVLVMGTPAGASVLVNGERVGALPLAAPVTVAAGEALVTVDARGFVSISRKVMVTGKQLVRETIDLPEQPAPAAPPPAIAEPTPGAPPPPAAPPPPPPVAQQPPPPAATSEAHAPPPGEAPASGALVRGAGYVAAGLGAVALVVGVIADAKYVSDVNSFNATGSGCGTGAPNRGNGGNCASLFDSFTTAKSVAIGGFVSAGILGALSAGLLWAGHRAPEGRSVACAVGASGGSCAFTF